MPPFYIPRGCGVPFFKLCLVPSVDWPLSLSIHAFLFFIFWGSGVKAKSSQVPDMFPKEFPIAPHFYPKCFDKCCPPFTYIGGPKGGNSVLQNRTFYFGEPP